MAFADASIGIYPSSTGEGGMVTVYDSTATKAAIGGTAYWNQSARDGLNARKRRTYDAIADLIAKQSDAEAGGIILLQIGSDGAAGVPYRLALSGTFPNKVIAPVAGS